MFEAIIVVCVLDSLSNCGVFRDELGPYAEYGACQDRLEEMYTPAQTAFHEAFPDVAAVAEGYCLASPNEGPTINI